GEGYPVLHARGTHRKAAAQGLPVGPPQDDDEAVSGDGHVGAVHDAGDRAAAHHHLGAVGEADGLAALRGVDVDRRGCGRVDVVVEAVGVPVVGPPVTA